MTATATRRYSGTDPMTSAEMGNIFQALRAASGIRNFTGTYSVDATPAAKDQLRRKLADMTTTPRDSHIRLAVRRYFNTYRQNGWRIVAWQVTAAVKLLDRIDTSIPSEDRRFDAMIQQREADQDRAAYAAKLEAEDRLATRRHRGTRPGHNSPRCLTEDTDGECVCR